MSIATTIAVKSNFTVTVAINALTNLIGDFSTALLTHLYMITFSTAKTTGTAIKESGMAHFRLEK